jgi:WD40 repeat protein
MKVPLVGDFALAITPDGSKIISGSHDHSIKIWDNNSEDVAHELFGHTDWVEAVAVSRNGQYLISGSFDQRLIVWDMESGTLLHTLEGHSGPVVALAVTPCGKKVASTSWDRTLRVWDIETGQLYHSYKGAEGYRFDNTHFVNALAISPDGQGVLHMVDVVPPGEAGVTPSVPRDCLLRIWSPAAPEQTQLRVLGGPISSVQVVCFTADSRRAISGSYDGSLGVWDIENAEIIATYYVWSCAVASDGATIAAGDEVGRVHYLRLDHGTIKPAMVGQPGRSRPDGSAMGPQNRRLIRLDISERNTKPAH